MIPKKIHYCWFGNNPIPKRYAEFIKQWKKLMPAYSFKLWNEQNSPMHLPYMKTAFANKKWANLSNYTRLHALYNEGGIYLDVDVEVLQSFDSFLNHDCFLGFETDENSEVFLVNNAILGASPRHEFIRECKVYLLSTFDGTEYAHCSSPDMTTWLLRRRGLTSYEAEVAGIKIYSKTYFYPFYWNEDFSPSKLTDDTVAVHHWAQTWSEPSSNKNFLMVAAKVASAVKYKLPLFYLWFKFGALGYKIARNRTVIYGPFKGMRYASLVSSMSQLMPKLCGSYEEVLQPIIYDLLNENYQKLINVGCGEGYYTVGLTLLLNHLEEVKAYDIHQGAIAALQRNAHINAVDDIVQGICKEFSKEDILREDFTKKTILFCDIEGQELELFQVDVISHLKTVDIILELHSFIYPNVKQQLVELFKTSHIIQIVGEKSMPAALTNLSIFSPKVRKIARLLDEKRPEPMEWMILKSKIKRQ